MTDGPTGEALRHSLQTPGVCGSASHLIRGFQNLGSRDNWTFIPNSGTRTSAKTHPTTGIDASGESGVGISNSLRRSNILRLQICLSCKNSMNQPNIISADENVICYLGK
jgi:hypothetical protein